MTMFLFPVLVLVFIALIPFMSDYLSHIGMNKDQNLPYDWCDFKTFLGEFYKRYDPKNLEYNTNYKSIFLETWDNESHCYIHKIHLHASIIKFDNDKCMILYPWSYFKYCRWLKNYEKSKRSKGLFTRK